jgi:hypothetical protein
MNLFLMVNVLSVPKYATYALTQQTAEIALLVTFLKTGSACITVQLGNSTVVISNCVKCISTYYTSQGQCTQTCPTGTFGANGVCRPCLTNCKKCLNSTTCIGCNNGYVRQNNQCQNQCNIGYYPKTLNDSVVLCKECTAGCTKCLSEETCLECFNGRFLWNQSCGDSCPIRTHKSNHVCKPCPNNCEVCESSIECSQCSKDYVVDFDGKCVQNCSQGSYITNNHC